MNTKSKTTWSIWVLPGLWCCLLGFAGCEPDLRDDPIPPGNFPDQVLNLNLPEFLPLKTDGGIASLANIGVRGVLVYRKNATTYLVFERNCSFQPANACATVDVHSSSLFLVDNCCNSSFRFEDGEPTGGPAWRPLRIYQSYVDGFNLTITSDSANGM